MHLTSRLVQRITWSARLAILILLPGGCAVSPPAAVISKSTAPTTEVASPETQSPRGTLILVGGGRTPVAAITRFVELARNADGEGVAHILIFSMADPSTRWAEGDAAQFRAGGAEVEIDVMSREEANRPSATARFENATGVWFSGGQQTRLLEVLHKTVAERALQERFREGIVVGGTSAGASAVSSLMIAGGERHPTTRPTNDTGTYETIHRDNILTAEGLGLLPNAIVDQHQLRRRRVNRLISVVLEHPGLIGLGLDESAAVEVSPDGLWHVLPESTVLIFDARNATAATRPASPLIAGTDVRLHVLIPGSTFEPKTGKATTPAVP